MSLELFLFYTVTVFVASIIPGPSMLLALSHGIKYGAKKTIASALGNVSITLLQAAISIAGLGAILLASETLFLVVKLGGAAYLIYMGICLWCSPDVTIPTTPTNHPVQKAPLRKMYLQAAFVTAGNPKAIVFFTAIFPQFINPNVAYIPQFSILMGTCGIIAFTCFMVYAISGQKIAPLFSKTIIFKHINKLIGGTFIGAGVGLAASNR